MQPQAARSSTEASEDHRKQHHMEEMEAQQEAMAAGGLEAQAIDKGESFLMDLLYLLFRTTVCIGSRSRPSTCFHMHQDSELPGGPGGAIAYEADSQPSPT